MSCGVILFARRTFRDFSSQHGDRGRRQSKKRAGGGADRGRCCRPGGIGVALLAIRVPGVLVLAEGDHRDLPLE